MNYLKSVGFSIGIIAFFILSFLPSVARAQTPESADADTVEVVVFVRDGCTHCEAEEQFLDKLALSRQDITVTKYRLENETDRTIWQNFTDRHKVSKVTPITVIGNAYVVGFDNENTTGKDMISLIDRALEKGAPTDLTSADITSADSINATCPEDGSVPCALPDTYSVSLPFIGKIGSDQYPLLILSAILGFFDGFNPCAMWVLITFLIILLQVGDRRKMFLFAGTFILAEAVMYTLILTVWYKTWDFVQLDTLVTPIIGIVSIVGGIFFLREWRKKELECKVTDFATRQKTRNRIMELASGKFTIFTFLGILGIAFSVNIIEFACSIGIPQAFTKILEMNQLSLVQSMGYIATYIFFYMLDDIIVFAIALYGIEKLQLATKYSKASNLLGGIVMIILGLLLIFQPSVLLF